MDLREKFLINKARDLFEGSILTERDNISPAGRVKSKPAVAAAMNQQAQVGRRTQQAGADFVKKQQAAGVAQAQAGQTQAGQQYQQQTAAGSQGKNFKDKWAAMNPEEQAQMIPKYSRAIAGWIEEDPNLKPTILSILKTALSQKQ